MARLILMRHGKSMWNRDTNKPEVPWKYAGAVDIPLSLEGVNQALHAGEVIKDIPLDVVYCSMLIRAQTTTLVALATHQSGKAPLLVRDNDDAETRGLRAHTKKISEGSRQSVLPVYCSHQLDERNFGSLQGMYAHEQKRTFTEFELTEFRREWDIPFPAGESQAEVYDRCVRFFEKHIRAQLNNDKNVLICCHGFVVRALLAYILPLNPHQYTLEMVKDLEHNPSSLLAVGNAIPRVFSYKNDCKDASYPRGGKFTDITDCWSYKAMASKL